MNIQILITQMGKLFIIIFIGYFIYRSKLVNDEFVKVFTELMLKVTMPAMILSSVLNLEERQSFGDVMTAFAVAIALMFVILPIIGYLLARLLFVKKEQIGLYTFMNTYSNIGFMGFPVIAPLCGSVGLFYAAIFNLIFNLSIFSLGIIIINRGNDNEVRFDPHLLLSPGIIGAVLAIVIYFLDLHFPAIINETIDSVGLITSPSAMLLIGCSLATMDIKSIFDEWRLYPWTIIKQLLIPLALWFPLVLVIKNPLLLQVAYIMIAMPVANSSALFATSYGGDTQLAAKGIFISTLFSLVTVPLVIMIMM